MRLIDVSDASGNVIEPAWLVKAEPIHRQLRPQLPTDYVQRMQAILKTGAHLTVAVEGDSVVGVALWRLIHNTADGVRLYVDDLVTDEAKRSKGIGKALLTQLEVYARAHGCHALTLDSGVQRTLAHRFYFREGMYISSFSFRKTL